MVMKNHPDVVFVRELAEISLHAAMCVCVRIYMSYLFRFDEIVSFLLHLVNDPVLFPSSSYLSPSSFRSYAVIRRSSLSICPRRIIVSCVHQTRDHRYY